MDRDITYFLLILHKMWQIFLRVPLLAAIIYNIWKQMDQMAYDYDEDKYILEKQLGFVLNNVVS